MAIHVFIGRDSRQHAAGPTHPHERRAVISLMRSAQRAITSEEATVFVVAPHIAHGNGYFDPDLIVLNERGFGVVEMKHHSGLIRGKPDRHWSHDGERIEAGATFENPQQQVASYVAKFRDRLLEPRPRGEHWLPLLESNRQLVVSKLRMQSAVCFTNPLADLTKIVKDYRPTHQMDESFSVLGHLSVDGGRSSIEGTRRAASSLGEWILTSMRFGFDHFDASKREHVSYRVKRANLVRIAKEVCRAEPWEEAERLISETGEYGFMVPQRLPLPTLRLVEDAHYVGVGVRRDGLVLPKACEYVSRTHALVERRDDGVDLTDLSLNGTYVNGHRIEKGVPVPLRWGDVIHFGSPGDSERGAVYELRRNLQPDLEPTRQVESR